MKLKIKKETCSWKGVKEAPRKLRVEVYFSGILTIHRVFPDPVLWSRRRRRTGGGCRERASPPPAQPLTPPGWLALPQLSHACAQEGYAIIVRKPFNKYI